MIFTCSGIDGYKYNQMLSVPETKMEKFVLDKANVSSFVAYPPHTFTQY